MRIRRTSHTASIIDASPPPGPSNDECPPELSRSVVMPYDVLEGQITLLHCSTPTLSSALYIPYLFSCCTPMLSRYSHPTLFHCSLLYLRYPLYIALQSGRYTESTPPHCTIMAITVLVPAPLLLSIYPTWPEGSPLPTSVCAPPLYSCCSPDVPLSGNHSFLGERNVTPKAFRWPLCCFLERCNAAAKFQCGTVTVLSARIVLRSCGRNRNKQTTTASRVD